jgi:phage gp45-like
MSHPHRAIRFGRVLGPSKDKGPHKQVKVRSNGREFRAKVWEPYGVSGNPVTDSECLILVPEGDEGKAVVIPMPPPAKRRDGQSEGDLTYENIATGAFISMSADGSIVLQTGSSSITLHRDKIVLTAARFEQVKA